MDYIIYKITLNEKTDYIYVGSTKEFNRRKCFHKFKCNTKHDTLLYNTINRNGGWDKCEMTPIEKFNCETIIDARIREEHWRRELNANLNTIRCYTTTDEKLISDKKYREVNREKIVSRKKEYYNEHKEHDNIKSKQWRESHKEEMKDYKQEWYLKNKEKRHQENKIIIDCLCGKVYTKCNEARHLKTKYHLEIQLNKSVK